MAADLEAARAAAEVAPVAERPLGDSEEAAGFLEGEHLVAGVLARSPRPAVAVICAGLIAASTPFMLSSALRPLIGSRNVLTTERPLEYFAASPGLAAGYVRAVEASRDLGARRILVTQGEDSFEYPLWALIAGLNPGARVYEERVRNPSARLVGAIPPDMMICTIECSPPSDWYVEDYPGVRMAWPFES